ncbi:MAG: RNA pseudouridine synthase [Sedimentisphaerales bacterium]|nr:RNA pseudouridine synthase [Sedimentisphaerales bacterium]
MGKPNIKIIYSDEDVLVINKPAGVSVTKDRMGSPELVDVLAEQLGADSTANIRLVHRLDKWTSGVMILARNKKAQSRFSSCFENRLIKKTYLAIVTGITSEREGQINARLGRNRRNTALMNITSKKGKEAVTRWKLLANFGSIALLAVNPITGRTHQIRVHLPSIDLPLVIDPVYGSSRGIFLSDFKLNYRLAKEQVEKPLIERLTLHAYQLEFVNPEPNLPEYFIAQLDKKFAAAIKMLTKYNPSGTEAFIEPDDFERIISGQKLD